MPRPVGWRDLLREPPWIVRVVLHPDRELDLLDPKGVADHGKIVGFFTFLLFYSLIWFDKLPNAIDTALLLFAAYGWIGLRLWASMKGKRDADG